MSFDHKKFDAERTAANEEIVRRIQAAMKQYPSMRFHQLLEFLGVIREHKGNPPYMANQFYDEPQDVLKYMDEVGRG